MCGDFGLSQDSADGLEVTAPFCKRYGCDDCLPIVRRELRRRIVAGQPNKLVTLTLRREASGCPIEAAGRLMHWWDTLLKRIRRHFPNDDIQFLHVKEGTRKGWPHLHIVMRMPSLDHTILRAWWEEITSAFQIDIRAVKKVHGVAKYLAKYLTKDLVKFGPYRVFSNSRRWELTSSKREKPVFDRGAERPTRIEGGVTAHRAMLVRAGYYEVPLGPRCWKLYDPHSWPEYAIRERWRRRKKTTTSEMKLNQCF